jgi:hypothetical protein
MKKFLSILYSIALFGALLGFGAHTFLNLQGAEGSDGYGYAYIIGVAFLILSVFPLISIFIKFSIFSRRRPILAILTVLHDLYFTGLVINTAVQFSDGGSVISLVVSAIMAVLGISSIISVFSTLAKD